MGGSGRHPAMLALGLWLGLAVAHEPVQRALRGVAAAVGAGRLDAGAAAALGAAALPLLAWGLWTASWRRRGEAAVVAALAVVAGACLVRARIEWVHLPQYALIAALLRRGGLPPTPALVATVALGALDEGAQVWTSNPDRRFDGNDAVLNALGAWLGLWWADRR